MKASLSIAALLGALLATAAPADVSGAATDLSNSALPALLTSSAAQKVEPPTEKSVSGSKSGPPVCGTCHDGAKQCCGLLVATGAYGCYSQKCTVAQQQKTGAKSQALLQGLHPGNATGAADNSTVHDVNLTTVPDDKVTLSPLALP
ncbi:hypothetical protein PspLS_04076 [Pyricularia sp. CBS 133598]|nr:hypothetical protein PspLS_04076 [Pyricularia sp. CBS 133598]